MMTNKLTTARGVVTLKNGDVLTCSSNRWLGRAIQKLTKSKYNHSALVIEIWGRLFVSDSQKDGTNPRPLEEWVRHNYSYVVHRPKEVTKTINVRAASKWGNTKYDFASLLWWYPLYLLTKKWRGKKGKDASKAMYCSEYVGWVYNFENWWQLSPQNLFEELEKSDKFIKL